MEIPKVKDGRLVYNRQHEQEERKIEEQKETGLDVCQYISDERKIVCTFIH
jgi:hypothetical protein